MNNYPENDILTATEFRETIRGLKTEISTELRQEMLSKAEFYDYMDRFRSELDDRFEKMHTDIVSEILTFMEGIVESIHKRIDTVIDRLEKLEKRMDSLEKRMDILEKRMDSLTKTVSELVVEVREIKIKIHILEEKIERIEVKLSKVDDRVSSMELDIGMALSYRDKITKHEKRISEIELTIIEKEKSKVN